MTFIEIISALTVASHIVLAILVVSLVMKNKLAEWISERAMLFAFLVALLSTIGSFYFSEIVGFEPCRLCWYQRIFLFPQVVILGLAWWHRDGFVRIYSISLSIIGALIAVYHVIIQNLGYSVLPCSAEGASCIKLLVHEFGYVTIPVMSLTAFLYLIFFMVATKSRG